MNKLKLPSAELDFDDSGLINLESCLEVEEADDADLCSYDLLDKNMCIPRFILNRDLYHHRQVIKAAYTESLKNFLFC